MIQVRDFGEDGKAHLPARTSFVALSLWSGKGMAEDLQVSSARVGGKASGFCSSFLMR
ncbi:hypothetical protein KCP73_02190 [Salmonella enterica subsp. enterica]|nr:hypothetical protein KCP73_02190 [Salmonella enterica subsp. enterica]